MSYKWREVAKHYLTPYQRHRLVMLRERLYEPYTRATARWRCLPDFIIIGASRSGTTSLFNTIRYHPQVRPARLKEVHFFDKGAKYQNGESKYRSYFPLTSTVQDEQIVGEATPGYLQHPEAAKRIQAMVPNTKLIVLLRNPTDRFISRYFYRQEKRRNQHINWPDIETYVKDPSAVPDIPDLTQASYYTDLQRYDTFLRSGQLHVMKSENYFHAPEETMRELCRFLRIDESFQFPKLPSRNAAQKRTDVSPEVRSQLDALFAPEREQLYNYLGISWAI